ncbi:hypothetical protein ACFQ6S_18480 [Streptomyces sp. NPDC056479]
MLPTSLALLGVGLYLVTEDVIGKTGDVIGLICSALGAVCGIGQIVVAVLSYALQRRDQRRDDSTS